MPTKHTAMRTGGVVGWGGRGGGGGGVVPAWFANSLSSSPGRRALFIVCPNVERSASFIVGQMLIEEAIVRAWENLHSLKKGWTFYVNDGPRVFNLHRKGWTMLFLF